MRVLVAYGSKLGGTAGLAEMVGTALRDRGADVNVRPARNVMTTEGYDAVIVGGALYAGRWRRDARRFVKAHAARLGRVPVWFFSSGPLDESATERDIPPTGQVRRMMGRVGARGHVTFGGRLVEDPPGFMAQALAKTFAGDYRDAEHVARWVDEVWAELSEPAPAVGVGAGREG